MRSIKQIIGGLLLLFVYTGCSGGNDDQTIDTLEQDSNIFDRTDSYSQDRILVAYFSRWGNTDFSDEVDVNSSASILVKDDHKMGTTEYMARLIQEDTAGDIHQIQTKEAYPEDFDELRALNHTEIEENFLPPLKNDEVNYNNYDIIFLGFPVWATTVPRAVLSFIEESGLTGKTLVPFFTHDGYGAGTSLTDLENAISNATFLNKGLGIESEDIAKSQTKIETWLSSLGLGRERSTSGTPIEIAVEDFTLEAVFFDTELAEEVIRMLPMEISMSNFSNRELYGALEDEPENISEGPLTFEDGDITYCPRNNTIAIFYNQSSNPHLTMEVIPIGRVDTDIAFFKTLDNRVDVSFRKLN